MRERERKRESLCICVCRGGGKRNREGEVGGHRGCVYLCVCLCVLARGRVCVVFLCVFDCKMLTTSLQTIGVSFAGLSPYLYQLSDSFSFSFACVVQRVKTTCHLFFVFCMSVYKDLLSVGVISDKY